MSSTQYVVIINASYLGRPAVFTMYHTQKNKQDQEKKLRKHKLRALIKQATENQVPVTVMVT